jgi:hypothetical protein
MYHVDNPVELVDNRRNQVNNWLTHGFSSATAQPETPRGSFRLRPSANVADSKTPGGK